MEEELTDEKIGAVQFVLMAVSAGRARAQFPGAVALSQDPSQQSEE